jgi:hypothetical protein
LSLAGNLVVLVVVLCCVYIRSAEAGIHYSWVAYEERQAAAAAAAEKRRTLYPSMCADMLREGGKLLI